MKLRDLALIFCAGWLALLLARDAFDGKPDRELAQQMTDSLVSELRERGWEVITAEEKRGLEMMILEGSDSIGRLNEALRHAAQENWERGATFRAIAEVAARAEAVLELTGEAHAKDTVPYLTLSRPLPDSVVAIVANDPTFMGTRIRYTPRDSGFWVAFQSQFDALLTWTEAADGRILFAAHPGDSRIRMTLTNAYWSPPPPVQVCTTGQKIRWAVVGKLGGDLLQIGLESLVR